MNKQPATEQPQPRKSTYNPPDPTASQISAAFHVRAGQSADEFRKTLITLSVGAVGFNFAMLTGDKAPASALSGRAKIAVVVALLAFALAIACGLAAWYYAGRDFHDKAEKGANEKGRNHTLKNGCDIFLLWFFVWGVLFSYIYFAIRVDAW